MGQSRKKANRRRQKEEEIPNWSELCPDLLRYVFKRLSFVTLNRAKSVCSSWHTASRHCIPNRNQIPWLILFPRNKNRCELFIPEDKDKVYTSRDLGVGFSQRRCLSTCGSWLLMSNPLRDLYMLNLLTGERIDLPDTQNLRAHLEFERACFWIDNKTKDYLVVWMSMVSAVFTKKGNNKWQEFPVLRWYIEIVYNHKAQKLYGYSKDFYVKIWDFSGDNPREDGSLDCFRFNHYDFPSWLNEEDQELYWEKLLDFKARIAVTVSGDVLIVACIVFRCKTWHFRVYKTNHEREWVKINSLGDEALIYDMGITVVAKDIPGIKRNSIYFSGLDYGREHPDNIFVFDLNTQKMQHLPQCVFSSMHFSHARWFFPC